MANLKPSSTWTESSGGAIVGLLLGAIASSLIASACAPRSGGQKAPVNANAAGNKASEASKVESIQSLVRRALSNPEFNFEDPANVALAASVRGGTAEVRHEGTAGAAGPEARATHIKVSLVLKVSDGQQAQILQVISKPTLVPSGQLGALEMEQDSAPKYRLQALCTDRPCHQVLVFLLLDVAERSQPPAIAPMIFKLNPEKKEYFMIWLLAPTAMPAGQPEAVVHQQFLKAAGCRLIPFAEARTALASGVDVVSGGNASCAVEQRNQGAPAPAPPPAPPTAAAPPRPMEAPGVGAPPRVEAPAPPAQIPPGDPAAAGAGALSSRAAAPPPPAPPAPTGAAVSEDEARLRQQQAEALLRADERADFAAQLETFKAQADQNTAHNAGGL